MRAFTGLSFGMKQTGRFRMWYNVYKKICYAESTDGVNWEKPVLGQLGTTNMINLFDFQSPSFILDKMETDPAKRYKAIGSKEGFSKEIIDRLKSKFRFSESYHRNFAYCAAYSADGLELDNVPRSDFDGDGYHYPGTGSAVPVSTWLFTNKPRIRVLLGRQVFLVNQQRHTFVVRIQNWSMATDEIDHMRQARKLEGGTHSEIYNMSAFYYAGQWLGLITHFQMYWRTPGERQS